MDRFHLSIVLTIWLLPLTNLAPAADGELGSPPTDVEDVDNGSGVAGFPGSPGTAGNSNGTPTATADGPSERETILKKLEQRYGLTAPKSPGDPATTSPGDPGAGRDATKSGAVKRLLDSPLLDALLGTVITHTSTLDQVKTGLGLLRVLLGERPAGAESASAAALTTGDLDAITGDDETLHIVERAVKRLAREKSRQQTERQEREKAAKERAQQREEINKQAVRDAELAALKSQVESLNERIRALEK